MIMAASAAKRLGVLITFAAAGSLAGCCVRGHVRYPGDGEASIADDISAETVALIDVDDEGDTFAFCTGVWVSGDAILTAGHCAAAAARSNAQVNEGVPVEARGTNVWYIVQPEVTAVFEAPRARHMALVESLDEARDVAVLRVVGGVPPHKVAPLAPAVPAVGEPLHLVGHPRAHYWTYMPGSVAALHDHLKYSSRSGPFVQVTAPIAPGMSGGGAWDSQGRLVGIVTTVAKAAPNMGFLVHVDTVRKFLADNKVTR